MPTTASYLMLPALYSGADIHADGQTGVVPIMVPMTTVLMVTMTTSSTITMMITTSP